MTVVPCPDRTLVVMRHSKSSWSTGAPDHDRPLSARGRRDGLAAGEWLAACGVTLDRAVVSTSRRTRETLAQIVAGGVRLGEVEFTRAVYDADERAWLRLIRGTDDAARSLLLIGHNPAVAELVRLLARRVGNRECWAAMDAKFPTSAIALIGFDGDWTDVEAGVGALLAYAVPRAARPDEREPAGA